MVSFRRTVYWDPEANVPSRDSAGSIGSSDLAGSFREWMLKICKLGPLRESLRSRFSWLQKGGSFRQGTRIRAARQTLRALRAAPPAFSDSPSPRKRRPDSSRFRLSCSSSPVTESRSADSRVSSISA